jgi:hypothetical protein
MKGVMFVEKGKAAIFEEPMLRIVLGKGQLELLAGQLDRIQNVTGQAFRRGKGRSTQHCDQHHHRKDDTRVPGRSPALNDGHRRGVDRSSQSAPDSAPSGWVLAPADQGSQHSPLPGSACNLR